MSGKSKRKAWQALAQIDLTTCTAWIDQLCKKKDEANKAYKNCNFENAIDLYTKAVEMHPDINSDAYRVDLYFNRAISNANLRKHDHCVADCIRAIISLK